MEEEEDLGEGLGLEEEAALEGLLLLLVEALEDRGPLAIVAERRTGVRGKKGGGGEGGSWEGRRGKLNGNPNLLGRRAELNFVRFRR